MDFLHTRRCATGDGIQRPAGQSTGTRTAAATFATRDADTDALKRLAHHPRTGPAGDFGGRESQAANGHAQRGQRGTWIGLGKRCAEPDDLTGGISQPVRHRTDGIADRDHGGIERIGRLFPLLRAGFAPLLQPLVQHAIGGFAAFFQVDVVLPVLQVGRQRGLGLHVAKEGAHFHGLAEGIHLPLAFAVILDGRQFIGLLFHFGGFFRVDLFDVLPGQLHRRFQRAHATFDMRIHRALVVDADVLVVLFGVLGADLGHPVFQVVGRFVGAAGGFFLHLQHGAQLDDGILAIDAELVHFRQQAG